jgi:hypothetical protein
MCECVYVCECLCVFVRVLYVGFVCAFVYQGCYVWTLCVCVCVCVCVYVRSCIHEHRAGRDGTGRSYFV